MNICGWTKQSLIEGAYYTLYTGVAAGAATIASTFAEESLQGALPGALSKPAAWIACNLATYGLAKISRIASTSLCCPSLKSPVKFTREQIVEGGTFLGWTTINGAGTVILLALTEASKHLNHPGAKFVVLVMDGTAVFFLAKGTAAVANHCLKPKIEEVLPV